MKEKELRACATCGLCKRKIGDHGLPLFYRVRIERHGIKLDAVQRQSGLAMMLNGHVALARAMGPDEDMTMPLMEPVEFTVCETCSTDLDNQRHCIARLAEKVQP
jgi:hypothetical protein